MTADYYCGTCIGRLIVPCDYCVDGCTQCLGRGVVKCPQCVGGAVPVSPPVWDSGMFATERGTCPRSQTGETPRPPRPSSRGDWRESGVPGGSGEEDTEASRLAGKPTPGP